MKKLDTKELNKWKELPIIHLHAHHREELQSKLLDEWEGYKLSGHCKPSTIELYRMWIVHCCQTLNRKPEELNDLTALRKYQLKLEQTEIEVDGRKKPLFSEKTMYVGIGAIRSFIRFLREDNKGDAAELDYILNNFKPKPSPQTNDDIEKLTLDEGYKFLEFINKHIKNIRTRIQLKLMMEAGLRLSEVVFLKITDVDLKTGMIKLNPSKKGYDGAKGSKKHTLPLGNLSNTVLKDIEFYLSNNLRPKSDTDLLLVTNSGRKYAAQNIRLYVKKYSIRALPHKKRGVPPHSLRHWFAIRLRADGNDLETIRRLLRHSDLKTTQIYFKSAELIEDLEKVYGKNGGNGPGNNQINSDHVSLVNHVNPVNDPDPLEQIEKLGNLMEKGFITKDEYESKKAELLKRV